MRAVGQSRDLQRILRIPRRKLVLPPKQYVPEYCIGEHELFPLQQAALSEAQRAEGLFANIPVGEGKSLIALLLGRALHAQRPLILVRPELKKQIYREIESFYYKHFKLSENLVIRSYTELSSTKNSDMLEELQPDLIVADEAHSLKRPQSVRTRRFLRYFREHPNTMFCALSGTMAKRSIIDYAHLLRLALRSDSPVPQNYRVLQEWSGAIDVNPQEPFEPGALVALGGENVRDGFHLRLAETPGVITCGPQQLGTSLIISLSPRPGIPDEVKQSVKQLRRTWELDGEQLTDAKDMGVKIAQLYSGFFYRWVWTDGKDHDWLQARSDWKKVVREFLQRRSRVGMDSPALVECAVREGKFPEMSMQLSAYSDHKARRIELYGQEEPPTEAVWVSKYVVEAAERWASKNEGIVWYTYSTAFEPELSKFLPVYGAGTDAGEATEKTVACSIRAQGTGKNLQFQFNRNLVLNMPASGDTVEQMIGRTHRTGQVADEVEVFILNTPANTKALDTAKADALYQQHTMRQRQKLLYASFV